MRFTGGLNHRALLYRDQRGCLAGITDFAQGALTCEEPVLIAVPGAAGPRLAEQLGAGSGLVTCTDMAATGRNPARLIPELRTFADQHRGRRIRIVGECAWPGRSGAELREAIRHEALVNLAFADVSASMLCLYDATGLPPSVIAGAKSTHPVLLAGGHPHPSVSYLGRDGMPPECERPLSPPPGHAEVLVYRDDLRPLRSLVERYASHGGLPGDRVASLVLAASELAANTLRHTSSHGNLSIWQTRSALRCQVQDQGWIADPLAGRRRRPSTEPGHGLWVVNQICDLTEMRTGPAGTTIRLHMGLPSA